MSKYSSEQIKQRYPQITLIEDFDFKSDPFLVEKLEVIGQLDISLDELLLHFDSKLEEYIQSQIEPNKSYKLQWRQYPAITGSLYPKNVTISARLKITEVGNE